MMEKLIYEKSRAGRRAEILPGTQVPSKKLGDLIPAAFLRDKPPALPEVSELEAVRHFVRLSQLNHSIDTGFYPLGSCTMKYNPKVNDAMAALDGFRELHPHQPVDQIQGALELLYNLQEAIAAVVGLPHVTLQPAAGAHGEMTGLLLIKAYFEAKADHKRKKVIVPDTAHGTNPATAALLGFEVVEIKSNSKGLVDIDSLKAVLGDDTAAIMLTNPNTLGLFEEEIMEVQKLVHDAGGLLYYDGANLNAIMGIVRPGDMGFDVCHLNLHKTFSTPHGGGGPGGCAVACRDILQPFLPKPTVEKTKEGGFTLNWDRPQSIGKVKGFYGNFGILVRAYSYLLAHGGDGLFQVSKDAILNANYLKKKLSNNFVVAHHQPCMHEFVLSGVKQKERGVPTLNIAKRLLDYGVHAPTVYFPLVVPEAMMIEPTETECKETLDRFAEIMVTIDKEIDENKELVLSAPHNTPVGRLDEATAARKPNLRWKPEN
ncbi:MAG: aminomethyl-transferring glycine dehydrogenase subunit GcvPB [Candidatus Melainabacteria bacterium]|jgi:glycine dehydrogenase subunit 2|uniref:Probable glycine dehydrogenase (decarboxylating) subunit 2 n=1 Tax=Candidatus Obscuribacter phosphatis TaxID=1906157 RepID=A0A8J7PG44_9BACT|nr:aminomethyl-transferring glycine dehydrogenase subunit GcvPB [Candidatus Obscuribacter phosphatis]MCA0313585.1 aminomethyl-transferring glycine dehydrogenase subunit GcvPB [Candidatus Melainabacteria bacterium]